MAIQSFVRSLPPSQNLIRPPPPRYKSGPPIISASLFPPAKPNAAAAKPNPAASKQNHDASSNGLPDYTNRYRNVLIKVIRNFLRHGNIDCRC